MEWLTHLIDAVPSASAPVVATIAMVVEFGLRLIKSDKPLGIIHTVAGVIHGVANLLSKIAALTDAVLPQRLN